MPNWCSNTMTITGPANEITELYKEIQAKGKLFDVLVPMPEELRETSAEPNKDAELSDLSKTLIEKYGADNWYDWSVKAWGTKWDIDHESIDEFQLIEHTDGTASIVGNFETAWAPAIECFNTFLNFHENISIECLYYEPGMGFAGIYDTFGDDYIDDTSSIDWSTDDSSMIKKLDSTFGISGSDWLETLKQMMS